MLRKEKTLRMLNDVKDELELLQRERDYDPYHVVNTDRIGELIVESIELEYDYRTSKEVRVPNV